jgi:quercetin dioxygenase-like cupin family protein
MSSMEIDKLEELYKRLTEIPTLGDILVKREPNFVEYHAYDGKCTSFALRSQPDCGICEATMSAGAKLEIHAHRMGYEILIILEGSLDVHYKDGRVHHVKKNGFVVIEEHTPHYVSTEEETRMIGITVPKDEAYP